METDGQLLPEEPTASLDAYRARGGGAGLARALDIGPVATIEEIRRAGLRGRGGAGFPTGIKWQGIAGDDAARKFVVCNAAEGEPATFKDRWLIRRDPYQVLEGIAIATHATGAERAFIGVKERFELERHRLEQAAEEMTDAGLLDGVLLDIVPGPDDYLFGEEKGLLEVIEGRDPLPRLYPPYVTGLFEEPGGPKQPAVVNNAETLSNVPHIMANGAGWFRSRGTPESPGTMIFTVCGDVRRETVVELELGTPLSFLVYVAGEGLEAGRRLLMAISGVSNAPLGAAALDTPMSYEAMAAIGSGLGSGGYVVYDDTVCVAQVAAALSAFLYRGSCGQCPPCKLGTEALTERFTTLGLGGGVTDLEDIGAWLLRVTDANRCGLGAGQKALAEGLVRTFGHHLAAHADGAPCAQERRVTVPLITEYDAVAGRFRYAEADPYRT